MKEPILSTEQTNRPPIHFKQRYEQVADRILAEIRAGHFGRGQRLPAERELAQQYDVGRASVREALGFLALQGVVETRPGAGSYVVGTTPADARALLAVPDSGPGALLQARSIFEPSVARMAAASPNADAQLAQLLDVMLAASDPGDAEHRRRWSDADRDFHFRIAELTHNPVLVAMATHVRDVMDQPLWQRLRDDGIAIPGRMALQLAEHQLIAAAIAEGDAGGAELIVHQHINRVRRDMALD